MTGSVISGRFDSDCGWARLIMIKFSNGAPQGRHSRFDLFDRRGHFLSRHHDPPGVEISGTVYFGPIPHECPHKVFRSVVRADHLVNCSGPDGAPGPDSIRLLTRNGHDWSPRYPLIVEEPV